MDTLDASYQTESGNNVAAETHDADDTLSLDTKDIAEVISVSRDNIQSELATIPSNDVSVHDKALLDISASDVTYSFVDTLQHNGINSLEITSHVLDDPRSVLQTVFEAGDTSLRERGIPAPDVEFYQNAMETAQSSGQDFHDVISDMRSKQPLMMRQDLILRDNITFMDEADTVSAAPEYVGPVNEVQYDVHVMAYPLKSFESIGVESRDSHGFVVITERGDNPLQEENALLVTRGGPDETGWKTWVAPDFVFPNEQSPDESLNAGNVFIKDDMGSRDDYDASGVFHIETYEVTHDLETMRDLVGRHRALINDADIDYEVLNRNSNTYTGDVTELLTGESSEFNHVTHPVNGGWRRLPAFENDLTDYSKTEFSQNFGFKVPESQIENNISLETQNHYQPAIEESYENGL